MQVTVTGASGNLGTALLRRLAVDHPTWQVVGVARRRPERGEPAYDRVRWVTADLAGDASAALDEAMAGSDAVVHLAWLIQPARDEDLLERVNVGGSRQVFDAVARSRVPHLVHASSVGAYSPAPKTEVVDESWPTDGVPTSSYSRHKVAVERLLDDHAQRPGAAVVARLRPGLIFQQDAGSEVARYFLGPLVPSRLLGARHLPVVPVPDAAVFQVVHAEDVADAVVRMLARQAQGAFNLAGTPVITPHLLAEALGGRRVPVPPRVVRLAASLTWRARLQPTDPGWVDLAMCGPVMATGRARDELDWHAHRDARAALAELLEGMRRGAGTRSKVLAPRGRR
jgi:nucleoside-diphosphate-sugar epimerase